MSGIDHEFDFLRRVPFAEPSESTDRAILGFARARQIERTRKRKRQRVVVLAVAAGAALAFLVDRSAPAPTAVPAVASTQEMGSASESTRGTTLARVSNGHDAEDERVGADRDEVGRLVAALSELRLRLDRVRTGAERISPERASARSFLRTSASIYLVRVEELEAEVAAWGSAREVSPPLPEPRRHPK